jgi:hypothetical protein
MSKNQIMDRIQTHSEPLAFDLFAQPFRILRIDPAAASRQVHDAFDIAHQRQLVSDDILISARNAILDPSRRLSYELSYLIDSPPAEIDALYAILSSDASAKELLAFADRLAPLSRANFVAHIGAHRPAESALLRAIVEAHVCIEPNEIYEILRGLRRSGGYPAPSLASVNQGLQELLNTHAQAAIAGFKTTADATEPVLACTQQILALDERHHIDVLSSLLAAYRRLIGGPQQLIRIQQVECACEALRTQPINASLLEALQKTLLNWASLCRPLIAFDIHHGVRERDFEIPTNLVRALIAHLTVHQQYHAALTVATLSRDAMSSMPATVDQLDQDRRLIELESLDAKMKPLENFIDGFHSDFGSLNQALKKDGFGPNATDAASSLWGVFVEVVKATTYPEKSTEPWMLVRDLAIHLSDNVGDAEAAAALLSGLIHYGEKVSLPPSILDTLRDDLRLIKSEHDIGESRPPKPGRKMPVRLAYFALAAFCAIALYLGFDKAHWWPNIFAGPGAEIGSMAAEAEVIPAVGGGQQYSLGNVRYCHFQEERLRIVKQGAHGPEDIKAFNTLVVDYNSRCSDFFYRDRDVATVEAEIAANRQRLAAEAERIMSTWPGHTPTASAQSAK